MQNVVSYLRGIGVLCAGVLVMFAVATGTAQACPEGMQPIVEMMPRSVAGPGADPWVPVSTCIPAPADSVPYGSESQGADLKHVHNVNNSGAVALWYSQSGEPGYSFSRWGNSNQEATEKDVIRTCERAGGANCQSSLWCLNCNIAVVRDSNNRMFAIYANSDRNLRKAIDRACKKDNLRCDIVETRDYQGYGVRTTYQ